MAAIKKTIQRRSVPSSKFEWPSDIPAFLRNILLARGINTSEELDLSMGRMTPPSDLKGAQLASSLVSDAIVSDQMIVVVGDYDADGATSTALVISALKLFGYSKCGYVIPNRFEDGYGLTPPIAEKARAMGADLLVTVDNGISSIAGVDHARMLGMKVVVTDHHLAGQSLPEADAIVNPNQPGCQFPFKSTAGVGVAFYLMCAVRQALRDRGWFDKTKSKEPNMASLLDLVALGTVADVVSLEHNNRVFVEQGLKRIRAGLCRPGIVALAKVANRELPFLSSTDLGFALGPRLNAAGRLDDMSIGIECLLAESHSRALDLAQLLNSYNEERKVIESDMQTQAKELLQTIKLDHGKGMPRGIVLFDECWHQGVVGLLASRVKEQYHRPVIAFAPAAEDSSELKGSARSIPGLHVRDALERVASLYPGLIKKFGGHAAAAGLSIERTQLEHFKEGFNQALNQMLSDEALEATLWSDGELPDHGLTIEAAQRIMELGPWGQGFPEPLFDGVFSIYDKRIVGAKHLKMILTSRGGQMVDAIQFNSPWVEGGLPSEVRMAYKLDINRFRGKESLQLMVEYIEA